MECAEGLWNAFQKEEWGLGEVSWVDGVRGGVVERFPKGKMGVRGS